MILLKRYVLVEIFGMQRSLVYISHADGYFLKLVLLRKHIGIALSLRKMNRNRLPQSFKIKIHGLYLIYHYLRTSDIFICLRMNGTVDDPVGPSVDKDIIIIQTDKLLKIYLGVIIAAHLLLDHTVYPRALQHKLHILAALLTVVYIPTAQDELNQRPYRDRYCVFIFKIIIGHIMIIPFIRNNVCLLHFVSEHRVRKQKIHVLETKTCICTDLHIVRIKCVLLLSLPQVS